MKHIRPVGLVMLVVMMLAVGTVGLAGTENYYPLSIGSAWTYESEFEGEKSTVTVTAVKKMKVDKQQVILLETKNKKSVEERQYCFETENGIYMAMMSQFIGNMKLNPHQCVFKYPVTIGQTWKQSGKMTDREQDLEYTYTMQAEYSCFEEVKVPAGTFKAVKVIATVTMDEMSMEMVNHLAPGVGLIQKEIRFKMSKADKEPMAPMRQRLVSYKIAK